MNESRVDYLEERIDEMKDDLKEVKSDVKLLLESKWMAQGVIKLVLLLSSCASLIAIFRTL